MMEVSLLRNMFYVLLFLGTFVVYVRFLELKTLFIPTASLVVFPSDINLDFEDVYFQTLDGVRLNGWFIPGGENPGQRATVLFCHGNAGNIGDRLERINIWHQTGLNIFIFDYRGYGKSQGKPTEKGMYLDAAAAFDCLLKRTDLDPAKIIAHGVSLGAAAAIDLSTKRETAALIVESAFTSAPDMAKRIAPFVPSFLVGSKLDSINKIKKVRVPKLFIHSPQDEIVPFVLGKRLFDAARAPKEFLEISGDHNEGFSLFRDAYLQGINKFLDQYQLR